jgi:hypothetical protein
MSWIDKLETHGKKARKRKQPEVPADPPPVVHEIIVSVRPSNSETGFPGEAAIGWYTVVEGLLTMCDEHGRAGEKPETELLTPGANAYVVAARLTKKRWAQSRENNFNDPLNYGPLYGVV